VSYLVNKDYAQCTNELIMSLCMTRELNAITYPARSEPARWVDSSRRGLHFGGADWCKLFCGILQKTVSAYRLEEQRGTASCKDKIVIDRSEKNLLPERV
jgi:hypothetical protein